MPPNGSKIRRGEAPHKSEWPARILCSTGNSPLHFLSTHTFAVYSERPVSRAPLRAGEQSWAATIANASRWIRVEIAPQPFWLTIFLLLADLRSGLGDAAFYEISLNLELLLRA